MTDFSAEDVKKVAKLARLRVEDGEAEAFAKDLSSILTWVEQLQKVDTEGVPQLASVSDVTLPWRKDEVADGNKREAVLQNAPGSEFGCFTVPKVIE